MSMGLAVVAWNEFRGRNLLRLFDPRGARRLGWNQVGFIGLLVAYSLWSIDVGLTGPSPFEAVLQDNPQLETMLGPIVDLHTLLTLVVYGGVIVLSLVFQGPNSLYYFRRGNLLEIYLSQTPTGIVERQGARQRNVSKLGIFHETAKVVNSLLSKTGRIAELGPTNGQPGSKGASFSHFFVLDCGFFSPLAERRIEW